MGSRVGAASGDVLLRQRQANSSRREGEVPKEAVPQM